MSEKKENVKYNGEIKAYFAKKKTELESENARLEKTYNIFSAVRAITFLLACAGLIVGLKDKVNVLTSVGICLGVVFFVLVRRHEKIAVTQQLQKSKLDVADRYLQRFEDGWRSFPDDGSAFLEKEDTVCVDIDLLGNASLYQLINVAHTQKGRERLAQSLKKLERLSVDELKTRNAAVAELGEKTEFAISFEALGEAFETHGKRKNKADIDGFTDFCAADEKGGLPAWANAVRIVFPALFFVLLLLGIAGVISLGPAVIAFFVILCFSWITKTVTDSVIAPFYSVSHCMDDYRLMMELIADTDFKADGLTRIKALYAGNAGVLTAFKKLGAICQAYNIVYNPLIHQLLSGILLWDYQLAHSVSKWKKSYGKQIKAAFDGIYEMEFLLSLSVLPKIRNTVPADINQRSDDAPHIEAAGVYHPLISAEKVVSNDAGLTAGVTIITGSNMSGKTTFLRTVAINLALAYIGAPVCAESFSAGYMRLFTSMRVMDDVANGISTFYAEILRIKTMVEFKEKHPDEPMLCMIDEIFKGTNSADRIVGAREAVMCLAGSKSMVVVSTHDFELCSIEDREHNPAVNYHFEEYYEDDKLMFDYRIRNGRCTTTNAQAILRMAGICRR